MTTLTRSPLIQLRSGRMFDLLNPKPTDVHIEDIAHSLAHQCRFTGHTRGYHSVAAHSLLVSSIVPSGLELAGLLHDAVEAYMGDISTPVKAVIDSPNFVAMEDRLHCVIAERFGYVYPFHPAVKEADLVALATEKRDLLGGITWPGLPEPLEGVIQTSFPRKDYQEFLFRFSALKFKEAVLP